MFSFFGSAINNVTDRFVDWLFPLDDLGIWDDDDEVSW